MVKVVKDLLSIYVKRPDYFYTGESIKVTDQKQLLDFKTLMNLFLILEKFKLDKLLNRMT